jgi:flagellar hook assembly protein FlgD
MQNYPNPFNPSTQIRFTLPAPGPVRIEVFDVTGSLVRTLVNGEFTAGTGEVAWDGTNELGRSVASGIYLYRLTAGRSSITKKMYVLK